LSGDDYLQLPEVDSLRNTLFERGAVLDVVHLGADPLDPAYESDAGALRGLTMIRERLFGTGVKGAIRPALDAPQVGTRT
jgi:hypothetical protein